MTPRALALIIFASILAQVAIVMLIGLYRRKHQYRSLDTREDNPQSTTSSKRSVSSATSEPVVTGLAWAGFKKFKVQRRVFEDENHSICSFHLVPFDGKPLPPFRPGQFLTFKLQIEDSTTNGPKAVVRCYSLSDRPRPDHYRVSIKRASAPADQPDAPPGRSSNFFHDHVREGNHVMVKAPSGHFHLIEDEPLPVVLIGGGIGITPMLSILNTLLENGSSREVWLYYGVRNGADQIMREHLQSQAKAHANFHLHLCYSNPSNDEIEGVNYQYTGRVNIPLLRSTLQFARYQFYVCGPRLMMENLVPGLERWGVNSNDIHYESFGPATLVTHQEPKVGPDAISTLSIMVTFSKTGTRVPWKPDTGSLLEFAEAQGVEVESGCRAGSCGCCQTPLEAGEVEYSQQPDADVEPGHCLLCISTPKSDLTLAA